MPVGVASDPSIGFAVAPPPPPQIVPTSTSEQELCLNGMSFSRRNSLWANSALVVTVQPADWAAHTAQHGPLAGVALQVRMMAGWLVLQRQREGTNLWQHYVSFDANGIYHVI